MTASSLAINSYKLFTGDALTLLRGLPDGVVQTVCTSPPYYQLRNYNCDPVIWGGKQDCEHTWGDVIAGDSRGGSGPDAKAVRAGDVTSSYGRNASRGRFCKACSAWEGELGLEPSPDLFVEHLVEIFREVRRVLRDDGTLFVNIADTYVSKDIECSWGKLKQKDLYGIPHRLVHALQSDGWWWRNDAVWGKAGGNCPRCYYRIEKGSSKPECLAPNTPVFIRENGVVLRRPISYVRENSHRLQDLQILSPTGWKSIHNVWSTRKRGVEFQAGKISTLIASGDHKFAVSHERRHSSINYIKLRNIRAAGYNDHLLFADISEHLEPTIFEVDLLREIAEAGNPYSIKVNAGSQHLLVGTTGVALSEAYGYPTKTYPQKNGFWCSGGPLINAISKKRVPVEIAYTEDVDYRDLVLSSPRKSEEVPTIIPMSYDTGRLIGFYAAEGGFIDLNKYPNHHQGKFTFHKTELSYVEFVSDQIRALGVEPTVSTVDNYTSVVFCSAPLRTLFELFVAGSCKHKSLNLDLFLNVPRKFRQGFLDGYFEGDGHYYQTVTSASNELIEGAAVVAASVGLMASRYQSSQYDERTGRTYRSYTCKLLKSDKAGGRRNPDGLRLVLPRNKKLLPEMEMIDIEVEDHLFVVDTGIISHNSVKDRFARAKEYVFLLTKNQRYYFDDEAVKEKHSPAKRRDVFYIPSQSFRGAHHAVMPEQLAEVCIRGGASEHGSCAKCRAPYKRVTKKGTADKRRQKAAGGNEDGEYHGENSKDYDAHGAEKASDLKRRILAGMRPIETVGWKQTCKCKDTGDPVPCIVMDPFSGAATTGAVALKLGHQYIGLELIESNNTEIATPRLEGTLATKREPELVDWLPTTSMIYHGRAEILLPRVPAASVRLILTDPPYNVSRDNNFRTMGRTGIDFSWDGDFDQEEWVRLADHALMPGGSIVIWNDWKNLGILAHLLQDLGYSVKRNLVWTKKNPFPRNRGRSIVQRTETGLWAVKPGAKWVFHWDTNKPYEDGIYDYGVPRGVKGRPRHEALKPTKMFQEIIRTFSDPGDLILDPFAGGGTTAQAAELEGRRHICFELDPGWYEEALRAWKDVVTDRDRLEEIDKLLKA